MNFAIHRFGPRKVTALKDLVVQAEAMTVPVQQLQAISLATPESEYSAARRVLMQDGLGQCRKPRDAAPHVCYTGRKINLDANAWSDHARSTTRMRWTKSDSANPSMQQILRPLFNKISTEPPCEAGTVDEPCACGSTGKNATSVWSANNFFRRNSARHW